MHGRQDRLGRVHGRAATTRARWRAALVDVAEGAGLPTVALITDMDQVLGTHRRQRARGARVDRPPHRRGARAAPARGDARARRRALCRLGGARRRAARERAGALDGGAPPSASARWSPRSAARPTSLERPGRHLPARARDAPVAPERPGYVSPSTPAPSAWSVIDLGGGRRREDDPIDHAVGLSRVAAVGERGRRGPPAGARPRPRRRERRGGGERAARRVRSATAPASPPPCARCCDERVEVPKAELHVHLEGTAPPGAHPPDRRAQRAARPRGLFAAPERFAWRDFLDFLRTYDLAASVIRTRQDYRDVTYEYLASCAAEGAIYVELIASPDHARRRARPTTSTGRASPRGSTTRAATTASRRAMLVVVRAQLRRRGGGRGRSRARAARPHPTSSASRWPATRRATRPRRSRAAYAIAADAGVGCTVHAGEWAGAELGARRDGAAGRHADQPRGAGDRGPGARRGARRARDRARGVPDVERRPGRVRQLREPSAARPARRRRARHAGLRRSPVFRCFDRRRVRGGQRALRLQRRRAAGDHARLPYGAASPSPHCARNSAPTRHDGARR